MTHEEAALAHLSDEPVTVTLSTGESVDICPVPLSVLSQIAVTSEQARIAHAQYHALLAQSKNPESRIWEQGQRLEFFARKWVKKTESLCADITCLSARPHIRGWGRAIRIFVHERRARRLIRRATWVDICNIVRAYRRLNDMDAIISALFGGGDGKKEKGKKKAV